VKPIVIADLLEGPGLKIPRLFTRMSSTGKRAIACCTPSAVPRLAAKAFHLTASSGVLQLLQGSLYSLLGSPVHDDRCPSFTNAPALANPNTSGAACAQCLLSFQLEIHESSMLQLFPMIQHNGIL